MSDGLSGKEEGEAQEDSKAKEKERGGGFKRERERETGRYSNQIPVVRAGVSTTGSILIYNRWSTVLTQVVPELVHLQWFIFCVI